MITATDTGLVQQLRQFQNETATALKDILDWWQKYMPDPVHGGFYGTVNNQNIPDTNTPKGLVLNARILWSFSAAYAFMGEPIYLQQAQNAYRYLDENFTDKTHGGMYWSLQANGAPLDTRKQIYGLAFCIYGYAEYYKICQDPAALETAIALFYTIEQHSFDKLNNGYIEAFAQDWSSISDLRLSEKDDNESKTMNTHLHIVEAYANLYQVWPSENLKERIANLLHLCIRYFINKNHHLNLFFDDNWNLKSHLQSYGHDIEAAWLLQQCAETIGDADLIQTFQQLAIPITAAALEGLDTDGGLWYEYAPNTGNLIKEKHAWVQAEAMIGGMNAFELTGNETHLQQAWKSWLFIKKHLLDKQHGEWYWGIHEDGSPMAKEKAGFWKCPYHSSRACIEINKRIQKMMQ